MKDERKIHHTEAKILSEFNNAIKQPHLLICNIASKGLTELQILKILLMRVSSLVMRRSARLVKTVA